METILVVSSVLLWVVVLINLLLTLALVRRSNNISAVSPNLLKESLAGQPAPHFTAETLAGEQVTLDHFHNRAVALVFVSPSCGPCIDNLPNYKELGAKAIQSGVKFILVSTAEMEETRAFVKKHNIDLPVLIAPAKHNSFMEDYHVNGTPGFSYINEIGMIEADGYPTVGFEHWKELVASWNNKGDEMRSSFMENAARR